MIKIKLTERQEKIIEIVKASPPITGVDIAKKLNLTRATLRPDLTVLTMLGILEARPKVGYFYTGNLSDNMILRQVKSLKVSEVKSVPVVVEENTTIADTIVKMFLENVGSIYIVSKEGFLIGLVSRKDLLKSTFGQTEISKVPVGVIMSRMPNIVTVSPDDSVVEAAMKIIDHEIDSLPIVEKAEVIEKSNIDDENLGINSIDIKNEPNMVSGLKVIGKFSKTNIVNIFVDIFKDI